MLGTELRRLARAGCPWVHLDIMDNHFVPNLTFGPPVVKALRGVSSRLFFDAHLMVSDPLSLVDPFAQAGVQLLTVHAETLGARLPDAIRTIRGARMRAGVTIKPDTPVSILEPVLGAVDLVLVMTVEPGFGGQEMMPSCLAKVRTLKRLRDQKRLRYLIQVDGGINLKTAHIAAAAGADVLVAGSAVFSGGRVQENLEALRHAIAHP